MVIFKVHLKITIAIALKVRMNCVFLTFRFSNPFFLEAIII